MDSETKKFGRYKESSDGPLDSEGQSLHGDRFSLKCRPEVSSAVGKVSIGCNKARRKIKILSKGKAHKLNYPNEWLSIDQPPREKNVDSPCEKSPNEECPRRKVLDPQEQFLQRWNKVFVLSCVFAVALDPLFFYIPVINTQGKCLDLDKKLKITACVLRSFNDIFYILHIIFQFRTGFIPPDTRALGRGELVEDHLRIAKRYLSSTFIVDILSILPLPQVALLFIVPKLNGPTPLVTKEWLKYVIFCQYVPRVIRIRPLWKEVTNTSGMFTETAWASAAFNLFLYMLASHLMGAFWYLLSIERNDDCLRRACKEHESPYEVLYCGEIRTVDTSFLNKSCDFREPKDPSDFDFGIFLDALKSNVAKSTDLPQKFFYCFWWGLRSLSSLGQDLKTSTYIGEIIFAVFIAAFGLVLFALLIGNMQTYLQSTTTRLEEMRVKRQDAEKWMSHRMLPEDLRKRIRKYYQYKWQVTRGVEEEDLIRNLPKDLKRKIRGYLFLKLLRSVPLFEKMDDRLKDAICHHLKPVLYTHGSTVFQEGDLVDEMLFIMRGRLSSTTTDGQRADFFNSNVIKEGDFCGEELLPWALDPQSPTILPSSTRTVKALSQVEAFALTADDMKSVASQFRRLHSQQLKHVFKFYSQQWRTWAACHIQHAWIKCLHRRHEDRLREAEGKPQNASTGSPGTTILAPKRPIPSPPQKPSEPDFSAEKHH